MFVDSGPTSGERTLRSLERCPQLRHSPRRRTLEPRANVPRVPREAISPCMRVPDLGAQSTRTRTALKLKRRAASAVRIGHIASARRSSGQARQPRRGKNNSKGCNGSSTSCWKCGETGHSVAEKTPASQDRQDATVGAIGRHFDLSVVKQASTSERF